MANGSQSRRRIFTFHKLQKQFLTAKNAKILYFLLFPCSTAQLSRASGGMAAKEAVNDMKPQITQISQIMSFHY